MRGDGFVGNLNTGQLHVFQQRRASLPVDDFRQTCFDADELLQIVGNHADKHADRRLERLIFCLIADDYVVDGPFTASVLLGEQIHPFLRLKGMTIRDQFRGAENGEWPTRGQFEERHVIGCQRIESVRLQPDFQRTGPIRADTKNEPL